MSLRALGTGLIPLLLLKSRDRARRGAVRDWARFIAGSSLQTELLVLSRLRLEAVLWIILFRSCYLLDSLNADMHSNRGRTLARSFLRALR